MVEHNDSQTILFDITKLFLYSSEQDAENRAPLNGGLDAGNSGATGGDDTPSFDIPIFTEEFLDHNKGISHVLMAHTGHAKKILPSWPPGSMPN